MTDTAPAPAEPSKFYEGKTGLALGAGGALAAIAPILTALLSPESLVGLHPATQVVQVAGGLGLVGWIYWVNARSQTQAQADALVRSAEGAAYKALVEARAAAGSYKGQRDIWKQRAEQYESALKLNEAKADARPVH